MSIRDYLPTLLAGFDQFGEGISEFGEKLRRKSALDKLKQSADPEDAAVAEALDDDSAVRFLAQSRIFKKKRDAKIAEKEEKSRLDRETGISNIEAMIGRPLGPKHKEMAGAAIGNLGVSGATRALVSQQKKREADREDGGSKGKSATEVNRAADRRQVVSALRHLKAQGAPEGAELLKAGKLFRKGEMSGGQLGLKATETLEPLIAERGQLQDARFMGMPLSPEQETREKALGPITRTLANKIPKQIEVAEQRTPKAPPVEGGQKPTTQLEPVDNPSEPDDVDIAIEEMLSTGQPPEVLIARLSDPKAIETFGFTPEEALQLRERLQGMMQANLSPEQISEQQLLAGAPDPTVMGNILGMLMEDVPSLAQGALGLGTMGGLSAIDGLTGSNYAMPFHQMGGTRMSQTMSPAQRVRTYEPIVQDIIAFLQKRNPYESEPEPLPDISGLSPLDSIVAPPEITRRRLGGR